MWRRASWILAASGALSATALGQPLSPAQFIGLAASVVRVEADREGRGVSVGSGVTVAPFTIATSCHVVRDATGIRVAGSGTTWNVEGERADTRHDLCFLRVPTWRGSPVRLSTEPAPHLGAPVVAMGFTGGVHMAPRMGRIRAVHPFDGASIIEADARFNSGSSGGGLFDSDGALIGLLTFRLRNSVESYYSIPVQWVREQLPGEDEWTPVGPLQRTLPFWQAEGDEAPEFAWSRTGHAQAER